MPWNDYLLVIRHSISGDDLVLLAAGVAALTIGLLVARLNITLALTPQPDKTIVRYLGGVESQPVSDLGNRVLRHVPALSELLGLSDHLMWLSLVNRAPARALVVGTACVLAGISSLLPLLTLRPLFLLLPLLAFLTPFLRLRSQANRLRRRLERSLPELTAILAAEMAAGLPPDQALDRASTWTGPLARLIQLTLETSRRDGQPVFGRGPTTGALVTTLAAYDLASLNAFATQLDAAARKGAAGPALMEALVQTYIVAHQDRALQEAEKLETRLAVPSVLFFFLPLLFLILVPMLLPLLRIL